MAAPSNNTNVVFVRDKPRVVVNQTGLLGRKIGDLIDVDTSAKVDGSLLIYDEVREKFVASTLLEKQTLNGGNF